MSLKSRFKKALFAFFKEEILTYVKDVNKIVPEYESEHIVRLKEMPFNVLTMRRIFSFDMLKMNMVPMDMQVAEYIESVKYEFLETVWRHVHVETIGFLNYSLIEQHKEIMFTLRIQEKKN